MKGECVLAVLLNSFLRKVAIISSIPESIVYSCVRSEHLCIRLDINVFGDGRHSEDIRYFRKLYRIEQSFIRMETSSDERREKSGRIRLQKK